MTILAAYVPTAEGRAALDQAIDEARVRGSTLLVARHVTLATSGAGADSGLGLLGQGTARQSGSDQPAAALRDELDSLEQTLKDQGIACGTLLLTHGRHASKELLRLAEEQDVELIVIGIRRRSPVGKAVLGSDAQDILLQATCPVLAVKAE